MVSLNVDAKKKHIAELLGEVKAIARQAEAAQRELTTAEKIRTDEILDVKIPQLRNEIDEAESGSFYEPSLTRADGPDDDDGDFEVRRTEWEPRADASHRWVNVRTGQPVYCLGPKARLQDMYRKPKSPQLSVGRYIQSRLTGNWKYAPNEARCAMGENNNIAGGNLVPEEMGAQVIDLARANSVLMQAGMQTVPMLYSDLHIARVAGDPSFEVKAENQAFTYDDITFDAISFTANTIGQVIRCSKELAMDAPNFPMLVENTLGRALGAEIDRICLAGNGASNGEPYGITNITGIGSTSSVGAIAWEDLHAGVIDIKGNNETPNAYICHPTIGGDLDLITSGDGTNSAKMWLGPPPSVSPLQRLETTNISTADVLIGDFTQALFATRMSVDIQMSDVAEDFFTKYQVGFRIVTRFDINVARAGAFHVLNGITT